MLNRRNDRTVARQGRYSVPLSLPVAAGAAAIPAIYNAGRALGRRLFSEGPGSSNSGPQRSRGKRRKVASMVSPDGTAKGRYKVARKVPRGKSKKKSLKDRVKSLEENKTKDSIKEVDLIKPMQMTGGLNEWTWWNLLTHRTEDYETAISSVGFDNDDFRPQNTCVKMKNQYVMIELKNNMTSNVVIEYMPYMTKDSSSLSPLTFILADSVDRGLSTGSAVVPLTAASALLSEIPESIKLINGDIHNLQFTGVGTNRHYKYTAKLRKASLGPGDRLTIKYKIPDLEYKPEVVDKEPFAYVQGQDTGLVLRIHGDLAHDNTNKGIVGYGKYQLDMVRRKKFTMVYSDGSGLHQKSITNTLTDTNYTVPVHADNHASAIEQGQN